MAVARPICLREPHRPVDSSAALRRTGEQSGDPPTFVAERA